MENHGKSKSNDVMHVSKVLLMTDIVSVNVPDKVPNKFIKVFKANANVHS